MFRVRDAEVSKIKFAGRSRATVLDNADPESKGRIRVEHLLLGESDWIAYLQLPGAYFLPQIGDVVYLECEAGYETHPVAWGNINKGFEESLENLPEVFQRMSPSNQGFYTPGGHLLELDEGEDIAGTGTGIRITTSNGSKVHINDEPTDNSVLLETANGTQFKIDGTSDKITATAVFGDNWELSAANGFQVATPAAGGTSLSMTGGQVDLFGAIGLTITNQSGSTLVLDSTSVLLSEPGSAAVNLSGGKVAIGSGAAELLDLCDQHLDALINNASSIALTSVGPAQLSPVVVTSLTQIKTLLGLIKGSL